MTNIEKQTDQISSINIYQTADTLYWKADVGYYINGKRNQKKFAAKTKEIIEEKIEQFKADIFFNKLILLSPDLKFEHFTVAWLYNIKRYKVKQSTLNGCLRNLKNNLNPHIGHIPMNKIKYTDIQNTINTLLGNGYAYSTIKQIYSIISGSMRYYRMLTEQAYNPCEGIELPRNNKRNTDILYYRYEERRIIERAAFALDINGKYIYRYGPAIVLMMYTGMRICEATALTWQDIDFIEKLIDINKSTISVNENGKTVLQTQYGSKTPCSLRNIPMTTKARWCLFELKKLAEGSRYVITTPEGNQASIQQINNCLTALLRDTNIIEKDQRRGSHSLRHTFASMLFENGCNSKIISELLGHSSVRFTENTYIHVINKQKAKAINDLDKYCI